ncbi:MAG: hypothetical protein P4L81_05250 [Candidatus Pacebacteria bacterium]|nr:hypothetical protein [Candidatus Paceibacterota bacterium]
MREALQQLREKPKHEKTAIAASIALGVAGILLIGWLIFFFHTLSTTPAPNFKSAASAVASSTGITQAQAAFSAGAQQLQQAYGSTTQFVESTSGTIQLEEVGSTTEPAL